MEILFITSGSIGDAIISTSLIAYLCDTYPQAKFTIAAGRASAPLFAEFPRLKSLIPIVKRKYHKHWWNLWQATRKTDWDIVVDLRGSLISYMLSAKQRKVFERPDKNKSKYHQLADLFGLAQPYPTRLWASEATRKKAADLLPDGKEIIVIAPKTNSAAKDWAIENFAKLMQNMANFPHPLPEGEGSLERVFVILAAKEQKQSVASLLGALPQGQVIDLSGQTDLLTAFAIIEKAQLFIGNDSGLLHIAAASGTKCVGIYGPSNDKVYAPKTPNVKIVKSYDFAMGEPEKRDNIYMQKISVEEVEAAAKEMLNS